MTSPLTMLKEHFVHIGRIWSACMLLGLSANAPASNQYLSVSLPALENKTKGVFIGFTLDCPLDSILIDETIQDIPWQKGYALERIYNGLDYLAS